MTTVDKEDSIEYWEDRYNLEKKLLNAMRDDRIHKQMKICLMKHTKKWRVLNNEIQIILHDERQVKQRIMMYRDFLVDLYGL